MRIDVVKEGMTVEIVSLDRTEMTFGLTKGMLNVGDKAAVLDVYFGERGVALDDEYTYHVKDLKQVKEK